MSEFTTTKWTVVQRVRKAWFGNVKTWVVYPPHFRRGGKVPPNRRFTTWDAAIDYVFEQMGCTRWQSDYTRQRQRLAAHHRMVEKMSEAIRILTGDTDG